MIFADAQPSLAQLIATGITVGVGLFLQQVYADMKAARAEQRRKQLDAAKKAAADEAARLKAESDAQLAKEAAAKLAEETRKAAEKVAETTKAEAGAVKDKMDKMLNGEGIGGKLEKLESRVAEQGDANAKTLAAHAKDDSDNFREIRRELGELTKTRLTADDIRAILRDHDASKAGNT